MRAWDACVAKYSQPYDTVGFGISLTKYGVYIKYLVTLTGIVYILHSKCVRAYLLIKG